MKKMIPMKHNGKILEQYYFDQDGNPYSTKTGWYVPIKPNYSQKYPTISPCHKGISKTITLHRLVCETFYNFPIPTGVTKVEWNNTPDSIKELIYRELFQAHHIDHDTNNFHPSNLEWVLGSENKKAYQQYKLGN